jgi:hypothetical protein
MQHDLAIAGRELACDLRKIEPLVRAINTAALAGG